VGGPGLADGERWAPDGENLGALVDALETFFGFGDGFNGGNPEVFGARSVESHADALPTVFDPERRTGDGAAEAQILRAGRSLEETVGLGGRKKVKDGLDAHGYRLV